MIIELEEVPTTNPTGDYIDHLLQDAAYEILRREGLHLKLSSQEWEDEAAKIAKEMRVVVDGYLTKVESKRSNE